MGRAHKIRRAANSDPTAGFKAELKRDVIVDGKGNYVVSPVEVLGSSLLKGLAARLWADVTQGAGVVLDADGKPVGPVGGKP
ncbi:hypothetical protein LP415_14680 [Polaromonas sp. P1(28)-8]|nr:hypothetical protein LP415_14680 [Polaromonas sp. P1(28)-8]